jgi:hypothetical protein
MKTAHGRAANKILNDEWDSSHPVDHYTFQLHLFGLYSTGGVEIH